MVHGAVIDGLRVVCFFSLLLLPLGLAVIAGNEGFLWLAVGAAAWAVSVLIKGPVTLLFDSAGTKWFPPPYKAAAEGFLSALCELGAAALAFAFLLPSGTAWHAAAFGAAAGAVEILWILIPAIRGALVEGSQWPSPSEYTEVLQHVQWTFVVERSTTLMGHIGSRGLVWLSLQELPWCAILAAATFTAVDGVATYGVLCNWDWHEISRWRRFYGFVTAVGVVEVLAFVSVSALTA